MIYFATADMRLRKVRASDGSVVWDVPTETNQPIVPQMNAVLSGEIVALARVDILAFDTTTGKPRWKYIAPDLEETGDGTLAANDSTIFAAGFSGKVHAVNSITGAARWVSNLTAGSSHHIAAFGPRLVGNRLFVCTKDFDAKPNTGTFWAIDTQSGAVLWSTPFVSANSQATSCWGLSAVWNDLVIQSVEDQRIVAFDQATGAVRWTAPPLNSAGNDTRWLAVGGGRLVATSVKTSALVAYDVATGKELWRVIGEGASLLAPAADSEVVYVDLGWMFASYDMVTGAKRWSSPRSFSDHPPTQYKGTPIISSDRLFIGGRDGAYALRR
jgi:outer membrane protein assembly factor BamB